MVLAKEPLRSRVLIGCLVLALYLLYPCALICCDW